MSTGVYELNKSSNSGITPTSALQSKTITDEIQKVSAQRWSNAAVRHLAESWKANNARGNVESHYTGETMKRDEQIAKPTSFFSNETVKQVSLPNRAYSPDLRPSLQPIQEWEGYVTSVNAKTFNARLVDVTSRVIVEQEEGQFPVFDVSDDDMPYLQVGAVFRWIIGYSRSSSGGKSRTSKIVFRKRPAHSRHDLAMARQNAKDLAAAIEWE